VTTESGTELKDTHIHDSGNKTFPHIVVGVESPVADAVVLMDIQNSKTVF